MTQTNEPVDVLIIGAGASGAAFAWSLADANINVMCLEQGDWLQPAEYPTTRIDWELYKQAEFNPNPNMRELPRDYPVNESGTPIAPLMYNAVGGSTIHWSAHFPRMHPSDFRVRTLDGVADDWPMTYQQLEPFFDLNDRMVGVAGITGDTAFPPKSERQTPPIPLGKTGDTIVRGFEKLGWHWWPADSAIITQPYDGRAACNNCGPCEIGCTSRAKASADVTYWPRAIARGAVLKTNARVREITVGKDGLADGVIYYDAEGHVQRQRAKVVVMACNGIGTPRLLLNSRSSLFPDGLGNSSGLLGRNLMFHPVSMVMGVFEEPLEGYQGPLGCSVVSSQFYETDLSRGFVRGYQFQILRSSGPAITAQGFSYGVPIPWGQQHHQVFDERFGRTVTVSVMGEDLPETHNRVELDPDIADSDGIPAPRVTYAMSENSLKMQDHGIAHAIELLQAAGAKEVLVNPLVRASGWHLLGTARMGSHIGNSVVDGYGRCHDVNNLFIIDGSVFVTAGAVNPTSTIQALALYIADYFKKNSRHLLD